MKSRIIGLILMCVSPFVCLRADTAGGIHLSTTCDNPGFTPVGSNYEVTCVIKNDGAVPALNVQVSLNYFGRTDGGVQYPGNIPVGGGAIAAWSIPAVTQSGLFALQVAVSAGSTAGPFTSTTALSLAVVSNGCAYTLQSTQYAFPSSGGGGILTVTGAANCTWALTTDSPWISSYPDNGTGTGTRAVAFVVSPNTTSGIRTANVVVYGGPKLVITQAGTASALTAGGLRFVSVVPCRVMETRPEYNLPVRTGAFGPPYLVAGETRTLTVSASTVCSLPATAKAFVANVTLVPRGGVDFVTVFPAGETRPPFRTVSSPDGQIVANSAIVKAGAGGAISVYASNDTDVLIDIAGYYTDDPNAPNLVYYPLTPCRVLETRADYRPGPGPFGPPALAAQQSRSFSFPNSPYCQVPQGAAAYSMTITAVPQGPLYFLTASPSGTSRPNASSLNSPSGRILANSVITPASSSGSIDFFASNQTDLLVDVNGYFAPDDGTGLYYFPVTQCRAMDATNFGNEATRSISVPGSSTCSGIPATAKALALNVTAMPGGNPLPFVTVYPTGQARPGTSILNAFDGRIVTNSAIIPTGPNGSIDIYAYRQSNLILEISGYFGR